ncbi:MAG: hypothetical protein OXG72_14435 [Acidobacteria bacterium]|nr:hypothetical protein [Acidobacteriota bacterium]
MTTRIMLGLFATVASPVTLPATWLLGLIGVLLAIIVWFLKRIITDNDKAHQELGARINRVDGKIDRVDGKVDRLASDVAEVRESIGRIEGHLLNRPTEKV